MRERKEKANINQKDILCCRDMHPFIMVQYNVNQYSLFFVFCFTVIKQDLLFMFHALGGSYSQAKSPRL